MKFWRKRYRHGECEKRVQVKQKERQRTHCMPAIEGRRLGSSKGCTSLTTRYPTPQSMQEM